MEGDERIEGDDPRIEWWTSGTFSRFAENFIIRNRWRFGQSVEMADLRQECFCVFLHVLRKYPDVQEPKHLMALYKTSLRNAFHEEAMRHTTTTVMDGQDEDEPSSHEVAIDADMDLYVRLRELSEPCKRLLKFLFTESPEVVRAQLTVRMKKKDNRKHLRQRETKNEIFCRVVGVDPSQYDLAGELFHALR